MGLFTGKTPACQPELAECAECTGQGTVVSRTHRHVFLWGVGDRYTVLVLSVLRLLCGSHCLKSAVTAADVSRCGGFATSGGDAARSMVGVGSQERVYGVHDLAFT